MYYLRLTNAYIYERFKSIKSIKEFIANNPNANGLCFKYATITNGVIYKI